MVRGQCALFSIAVLAGLCVDKTLGGLLRRQHIAAGSIQNAQVISDSVLPTLEGPVRGPAATVATVKGFSESSSEDAFPEVGAPIVSPVLPSTTTASVLSQNASSTQTAGSASSSTTARVPPTRPPSAPLTVAVTIVIDDFLGGSGGSTLLESSSELSTSTSSEDSASSTTSSRKTAPTPPRPPPAGGSLPSGTPQVSSAKVESFDLGYGKTSAQPMTFVTSTLSADATRVSNSVEEPSLVCDVGEVVVTPTVWSVVYTSTITWFGNPEDYTPPYPPLSLPSPTPTCIPNPSPAELTVSWCSTVNSDIKCRTSTATPTYLFGVQTSFINPITFLTTDKNPAVIYTSFSAPNYGISQPPKTRDNHVSATETPVVSTPAYNSNDAPHAITDAAVHHPTPSPAVPITVAVQPSAVVINGNTIRDNPATPTQVVVVAGQTFTIDPTKVVGAGHTVDRPAPTGGAYVPIPTTTSISGIRVVVISSKAIIGSSTFALPPAGAAPTTAIVSGKTFTIHPTAIVGGNGHSDGTGFPSAGNSGSQYQTLTLPASPAPTEVVVAGGDLITAIGGSIVIVHGTTITYATLTSALTTTLNPGDPSAVITIGPSGITLTEHASRIILGGPDAPSGATQYALVGGATLTKIGPSVVVLDETTYTVGPGAGTTITQLPGGETVTIGPEGVVVDSTMTIPFPFGPTSTTVIIPGATPTWGGAVATGVGEYGYGWTGSYDNGEGKEEEDVAAGLRPWLNGVMLAWMISLLLCWSG
ncbi:uncharacterized protein CTHT_0034410 [Thermochaetoides thermophila DSM 1495]|uniref:Uncharacterized protein n=1 Tax=Chaetomium thermophilum (strain DSM 1495 / CBS 144.50 / IMI 039719) TaxID=759272 RepID=G0S671_CHATD|nr:hypothetical protein CTHT_0034410 [Thermochaetoides thermophila DSM 1495]EGS21579.1 hypothetical protein CTHT_0034410 [Thermochaetoides thermophila DSM 1495]